MEEVVAQSSQTETIEENSEKEMDSEPMKDESENEIEISREVIIQHNAQRVHDYLDIETLKQLPEITEPYMTLTLLVQQKIDSLVNKDQEIGLWVGSFDTESIEIVSKGLRMKGFCVAMDDKKQMKFRLCC
jgi:hypothetical protein